MTLSFTTILVFIDFFFFFLQIMQNTSIHMCSATEKLGSIVIRIEANASITCNNCNTELHKNQISIKINKPFLCLCAVCGFKDNAKIFFSEKSDTFNCPKCTYLRKKRSLKENFHKEKKYECNVCSRSFKCKGHLNRHQFIHFGSKPFICEDCGSRFTQKSSLKTHLLIHKGTNPFTCKWCGQEFRHKQTLSNHVMSIHGIVTEIDNLYECDKCNKKFMHKGKLQRHYRSHSGEKPFKCDLCSKMFTQKINLKTHYKKHENESQFSDLCRTVIDTKNQCSHNNLSSIRPVIMSTVERNENHFTTLSQTILDNSDITENQFSTQSALNNKESDNEFSNMSQSVLNETEKGKLIQELLSFDNMTGENNSLENFSSIVQNEYRRDERVILKTSTHVNDTYFNTATSSCMIYSNNSVLYNLDDVSDTSVLPTFSSLNSVS